MSTTNNALVHQIENELEEKVDKEIEEKVDKEIEALHPRRVFTLFYRHGANPQCTKNFEFQGTFREAMDRARKHCEIMNYRFILLRPQISDLDLDEKNRANGINS